MRVWKRATLSAAVASIAIVAMLLVTFGSASAASAAGAGAVSETQTVKNVTDSFATPNPCTGVPGTVTETYNGVFHVTTLTSGRGAGTFWATGTLTGDFVFTPDDAVTQPSYSGHFTTWFGDNNNLQNGTETDTLSIHGRGSDGSTLQFHEVTHMSVSASGITFSFDKPKCG
ncbi:MAG: hypothetical protein ACXWQR_24050 [Ktedonobacterales bacterium]